MQISYNEHTASMVIVMYVACRYIICSQVKACVLHLVVLQFSNKNLLLYQNEGDSSNFNKSKRLEGKKMGLVEWPLCTETHNFFFGLWLVWWTFWVFVMLFISWMAKSLFINASMRVRLSSKASNEIV